MDEQNQPLPASLTADELAALTGLARASVYAGLESGELPGTRIGKRWIISRTRVQDRLGYTDEQVGAALEAARQRKAEREKAAA
jgi:excisionase family DNA binding protein